MFQVMAMDAFEHRRDLWHPHSRTSRKRFQIADFMYGKRDEAELAGSSGVPGATLQKRSDAVVA